MSDELFDDTLDRFGGLGADWDSYGGKPIDPRAIEAARAFRDKLWPVPTCVGGTQVEIHWQGFDFEVEFNADGSISGMLIGYGDQYHALPDDTNIAGGST